jgi:hypothetical protein
MVVESEAAFGPVPLPPELTNEQRAPAPGGRVMQGSGTVRASFDPPTRRGIET